MPKTGWDNLHGKAIWAADTVELSYMYESQGVPYIPLSNKVPVGHDTRGWAYHAKQTDKAPIDEGQLFCIAPNGTGKGASVIIPALLAYAGSMFVIDPKGENTWVTAERRRALGHKTVILDPFGEVNRVYGEGKTVEKVTKYNPLLELDPSDESYVDDIKRLGEAVVIKHPGEKPHWPDSARDFFGGTISLAKEKFGDEATFRVVRQLMTGDPAIMQEIMAELEAANPRSYAVSKLRRFFNDDTDEVKNVRSTAETAVSFMDSAGMLDFFDGDDEHQFTFSQMLDERTTVFVVLPPDRLETHARWLRLMLSLALKAITRAPRPPALPHVFMCDEMGTIGPLEVLETGFALFRGYGIRFFGFLQTISQLKRDYPKSWQNFIGNCSYLQCLGARDDETATFISDALGTTTWQSRDKTRQEKRPLLLPDEVKSLIGNSPQGIKFFKQILIRLDGNIKFLHHQNPYYLQPGWSMKYRQLPWRRGPWPQADMPVQAAPQTPAQKKAAEKADRDPTALWPPSGIQIGLVVIAVMLALAGFLGHHTEPQNMLVPGQVSNEDEMSSICFTLAGFMIFGTLAVSVMKRIKRG